MPGNVTSSLQAENGWFRTDSGLIIQWVRGSSLDASVIQILNWPIPFPNACLFAAASAESGAINFACAISSRSTTQVGVYLQEWSAGGQTGVPLAIGIGF